jgi:hypothetical protein
MRKGSVIGLVVGVVFMSIIVGIAAIPDEVLEESYIEKSKMPSVAAEDIIIATVPKAEITEPEIQLISEPESQEIVEPETPQVSEPEAQEIADPEIPEVSEPESPSTAPEKPETAEKQTDESKGKVIRVEVRDGVGTAQS